MTGANFGVKGVDGSGGKRPIAKGELARNPCGAAASFPQLTQLTGMGT